MGKKTMAEPIRIPAPDDMSYEAAEWHVLRQGMKMTLGEKLEWLEEAMDLARRVSRPMPRPIPSGESGSTFQGPDDRKGEKRFQEF